MTTTTANQRRTTYRATWNGAIVVESDDTVVVEGNHYFPRVALRAEYVQASSAHTRCAWKGIASYYDVVVEGRVNRDAARYYPEPSSAAQMVTGRVASWHGVRVERVTDTGAAAATPHSLWGRVRRPLMG